MPSIRSTILLITVNCFGLEKWLSSRPGYVAGFELIFLNRAIAYLLLYLTTIKQPGYLPTSESS